jgi:DNA-binding transcriptional LysR family regulator
MDYLAAVQAFVRAVDLGSFSKAAAEQELKVSTVSRYVSGRRTLASRSSTARRGGCI